MISRCWCSMCQILPAYLIYNKVITVYTFTENSLVLIDITTHCRFVLDHFVLKIIILIQYSWLFSRYLNSANASFQFFHNFIFTNGQPEKLMRSNAIKPNALQYIVWVNFLRAKFHESIKSAKFAEFKYLKKPTIR